MDEQLHNDSVLKRLAEIEKQLKGLTARLERIEFLQQPPQALPRTGETEPPPVSPRAEPPPLARPVVPQMPLQPAHAESLRRVAEATKPQVEISEPQRPPKPTDEFPKVPERRPPEIDWKGVLRRLNLLPPTGKGTLELQIGTWWASRIGALLGVIAAVFFAVYVSQHASNLVRFLELAAAAVGTVLLGLFLERKYKEFGAVIFGAGLAMTYFTAFAAYAMPAVQVISSQTTATLIQFGVVIGIASCALWRNSKVIASMAIFLGYVACLFSFYAELNDLALIAALLLGCTAVFFYLNKQWARPVQISVPLTYLIYAVIAFGRWDDASPGFGMAMGYLLTYMVLFGAADFVAMLRNKLMPRAQRRVVYLFNTTAAIGLGLLVTHALFPDHFSAFYFTFGAVLIAAAVAHFLSRREDALMHSYFVKGTALVTLGLMTEFEADTRWISLAVESVVLLFSARRSRLKIVEAAMVLVWILSFGFFVHTTAQQGYFRDPYTLWSLDGAVSLAYLFLSGYLFCLQARWLGARGESTEVADAKSRENDLGFSEDSVRNSLNAFYALFVGLLATLIVKAYVDADYFSLGAAILAATVALVGVAGRHWIPYAAAILPFLSSHIVFWNVDREPLSLVWLNGSVVIALTIAVAVISFTYSKKSSPHVKENFILADLILHGLWMFSLQVAYYKTFGLEPYFFIAVLTSIAVAFVTIRFPFHVLADLSAIPMAFAWLGFLYSSGGGGAGLQDTNRDFLLCLAALGAFGYACAYSTVDLFKDRIKYLSHGNAYQWIHTGLATLFGLYVLQELFQNSPSFMVASAVSAMALLMLARWPGLRPALYAAFVYTLAAHLEFYDQVGSTVLENGFRMASIAVGLITIAYAVVAPKLKLDLRAGMRNTLQWSHGILALALLLVLFASEEGTLEKYTTVFWGVSAIGIFLVGLIDRTKPFRIIGLAGLAICIPRIFIVDINDTLYRIIAFLSLSVVLLVVAFLYNKYKEIIEPSRD